MEPFVLGFGVGRRSERAAFEVDVVERPVEPECYLSGDSQQLKSLAVLEGPNGLARNGNVCGGVALLTQRDEHPVDLLVHHPFALQAVGDAAEVLSLVDVEGRIRSRVLD